MGFKQPRTVDLGQPVIVKWFDAHQLPESHGATKDLLESNCELLDIGFYLGTNNRYVIIATESAVEDVDDFRHIHYIPKVNIIRMTFLHE